MANKNQWQQEKGITAAEINYHELPCVPKFGSSLLSLQKYIKKKGFMRTQKNVKSSVGKCKKFSWP